MIVRRLGHSRNRYATSGRWFSSYYTMICLQCGWCFKPPRHLAHTKEDCDQIAADPDPGFILFRTRSLVTHKLLAGLDKACRLARKR